MRKGRYGSREWLPRGLTWIVAAVVSGVALWMLTDLVWQGAGALSWAFLSTLPRQAGRAGGIASILVSTALILGVCLGVTLPIGVGTAICLAEYTPHERLLGRLVRGNLDVLAGVPSIVFGLFGNAVFCRFLGLGFSILAGGLTLTCMLLPIVIRTTEVGLRSVPQAYRLGAAAVGLSQRTTLTQLLLPAAMPALVVGLLLGLGRALAETAALMFTSGYVDRMPTSLFDGGRTLALHIFELSMNVAGGDTNAYASALVLLGLLGLINVAVMSLTQYAVRRRRSGPYEVV